jgi:WD40 repeat protein
MWDIETGQCLRELDGHTRGLACVQYDGQKIVSGSNDKRIKVWDAKSGQCVMTCEGKLLYKESAILTVSVLILNFFRAH